MLLMPSDPAAAAARSFLEGSMTPAEALLLHLEVGKQMQAKHEDLEGRFFKLSSNASWPGGLAETLTALLFSKAESSGWKPTYEDYFRAVLNKTAGQGGKELRSLSAWGDPPSGSGRGHGRISDVDVFVPKDGLVSGYWRTFSSSIPPTFSHLLESPHDALGCQVKMRMDWLDVADDGHDSLQWTYFVESDTFGLEDFLANPRWLPRSVDLFLVVKFDIRHGNINARARLFDRLAIQQQIIGKVIQRREAGREKLAFGSQKFSFGECMAFPADAGADVSDAMTRLLRMPVPER